MAIHVKLIDYPLSRTGSACLATNRFRNELERLLGSQLDAALKAFRASESGSTDLSVLELDLAFRYAAAYDAARFLGLKGLGQMHGAQFDVRLI